MELIAPFGSVAPRRGNDRRHRDESHAVPLIHWPECNEPLPNTFLSLRVEEAFAADPALLGTRIAVETFEGMVQLSGIARWQYQLAWAKQLAWRVRGVYGIRSCVQLVRTTGLPSSDRNRLCSAGSGRPCQGHAGRGGQGSSAESTGERQPESP